MQGIDSMLSDFHFLRPLWLFGLLLLPVIFILSRQMINASSWRQVIDNRLLGYLLEDHSTTTRKHSVYLLLTTLLLTFICLAGPTWQKLPQPVVKDENALVIVLDLSLSMLATDVKPSRLVTAKHKLIDILNKRDQGQTGLIVYAGDAYTVSPLTDDTDTIKALVPALSPLIMPAMGNRVDIAMQRASRLLKDAGINHGRVLLMTDGIAANQTNAIIDNLSVHSLAILAFGTEDGGPIPLPNQGFLKQTGDIVIAKLDLASLQELANAGNARLSRALPSDNDIDYLLERSAFDLQLNRSTRSVDRQFDQWHEMGPWLLLIIIPLAALAFRRGWLLGIVILVMIQPPPAHAAESSSFWKDFWQTADQQGQQAFTRGQHSQAAELFQSPSWKGSAAYKAGDYQSAAETFAKIESPQAHYNRGNALAKTGKLDEAINAYNQALALNPDLGDAKANRAIVEQLKKQQAQSNQDPDKQGQQNDNSSSGQNQNEQMTDNQPSSSKDQPSGENAGDARKNQQSSPGSKASSKPGEPSGQQPDRRGNQGQPEDQTNKQANDSHKSQMDDKKATDTEEGLASNVSKLTDEQRQAAEQWLRRIPDDPGGLLKRKFDYQFRQRQLNNQFLAEQEDSTLW